MDPLYGYGAVNVEAQSRDPHSLLNWTRRMLALRRDRRAFGRGTQRFLYPGNRKVLAYLREIENETILCVFNLSRTPQAVELDLSQFEGRVPVEMTGRSPFPPIGQLTYLLTLPPYGFYWFELLEGAAAPSWHASPPAMLPEFATLVLRRGLTDVADPRHAGTLEREILPGYVVNRRWFGAKGEPIEAIRLVSGVPMPEARDVLLGEIEVALKGRTERYNLPLSIVWEDENPSALAMQLAIARVRQGRRVGFLTDAFSGESLARATLRALAAESEVPVEGGGAMRFRPTSRFQEIEIAADAGIRWLSAEQSNSSLIVGDAAVVKVIRHVVGGIHPEAEMTRHLTEYGFQNMAPLLGEVVREDADGTPHATMLVQGFVRNQGDAWAWSLEALKRVLDDYLVMGRDADQGGELFADYHAFARIVGRRLGELHAALSAPSDDEAFAPHPVDDADVAAFAESARGQLQGAFDILTEKRDDLEEACRVLADRVLAARKGLMSLVDRLAEAGRGALMTRIHGDFHLGQVLVANGDAVIIDFEGEPARTLDERRAKSSPLRDVAGLVRSFDYTSAAVSTPEDESTQTGVKERRRELLARFRTEAEAAFLEAYRAVLKEAEHPWADDATEGPLIDLFTLEKVAYEIRYEAANRPKWLPIPLTGMARLMERLLGPEETGR